MVMAIEFAVRDFAGGTQHGSVAGDTQGNFIQVGSGDAVSLNLSRESVVAYEQSGNDLIVQLVDGRSVVLSNYFNEAPGDVNHLYLSSDGEITEVLVHEGSDGALFADYGPVSGWDKWSPLDDMRFTQSDSVAEAVMVSNEPAGMAPFVPGLLGGMGGLGAAAAGLGVISVIGGGGSGGGGSGDTASPTLTVTEGTKSVDHVENAAGYADGVTLGGTSEPGASISVLVNGHTQTTVVDADGHWTVTFPTTQVEPGEYEIPAVITATDSAGNKTIFNDVLVVDTVPNPISFDAVTGDDKVNFTENATGLVVSGTSIAGATLEVTLRGVTRTVTADANGHWSATYVTGTLPAGEYTETLTAVSTDAHGNVSTVTHSFAVDTETSVAFTGQAGGDGIVNAAEAAGGVVLSGTAQAGAAISVAWNGTTLTTTADAAGVWTVTYPASAVTAGTYAATATVTATDSFGNTATASQLLHVDTQTVVAVDPGQAGGDDRMNAAEAANGLALTGTAEAGARVTVSFEGVTRVVTAGADGHWTANFAASEVRQGSYDSTVQVSALDSANNTSTTSHLLHVDTQIAVAIPVGQAGGDDKVSGAEAAVGLALNGTAEAGATVVVTFEGVARTVIAAADGTWVANFTAQEVRSGTYDSVVQVRATDAAGNTASASHTVHVDTETNVAIGNGQSGGDDVISGSEASAGVALTGTAEAGASVVVTMEGVSHTVVAAANGTWSATFGSSEIRRGSYVSNVTVTATDALGNTASASHAVNVDTEVTPFDRATLSTGSDAVLNDVEAQSGLTVTGHVEPGSSVMLRFGNAGQHAATVAADGSWSYTIPTGEIPAGENSVTLTAVATDRVGNVSTLTEQVAVDRIVRNFAASGAIAGDDVMNAVERAAGVAISGTAEPGAQIVVHLANGAEMTATAAANGSWSANFAASSLPTGEGNMAVTVTATDRAGNTASYNDSFAYDTVAPNDPWITNDSGSTNTISGIATAATPDALTYHAVAATGAATELHTAAQFDLGVDVNGTNVPSHWAYFTQPVADGSYLVIDDTDAAGNQQSTLYLRSTTGETTVDLSRAGLADFDFGTIDLSASHATLSLTEAQINRLTGADHQMAIRGGADDHVNLTGAVNTGHAQTINGESYHLYTLGSSGASVLIDDDIVTTIV